MLGAFGEATVRQTIKFRDQKPPKTRRFACSGSEAQMLSDQQGLRNRNKIDHALGLHSYSWEPVSRDRMACPIGQNGGDVSSLKLVKSSATT